MQIMSEEIKSDFYKELNKKLQDMPWPVIMPRSFDELLKGRKKIAIIDVRENDVCCFENINIANEHVYNIAFNTFVSQIEKIDLSSYEIIVTICFAGPKSAVAASIMRWIGYDNAFFLKGGVEEFSSISF